MWRCGDGDAEEKEGSYVDLEDESIEYDPDYLDNVWLIHCKYMQWTELCGHNNLLLWHHPHL